MDRRQFLCLMGSGLCGCATMVTYQARLEGDRLLVPLDELPPAFAERGYSLVHAADLAEPVLVRKREDGTFQALAVRCTHLGCRVRPARTFLTCPCHGSTFSWEGEVVRGPAQKPLSRYPVALRGGVLEIELR